MPTYKDLTGLRFGLWTVISDSQLVTSDRDHLWNCKCDCGTERQVRGSSLKKGKSQSCGCLKSKKMSERFAKDITGQRFGKLIALEPTEKRDKSGSIIWKCKCNCGNICELPVSTLNRDRMHSCGCFNEDQITNLNKTNLINQKFGKLLVIEETSERKNGQIIWKCKCDCGNIHYVPTHSLTSGNTSSCGCINYSIGEKNIEQIFKDNHIIFVSQYTNSELNKKRFDFAIIDNDKNIIRLIEFDGSQHYNNVQGLWNSKETLEDIQERDKMKNGWAAAHNIPLVRIPYWERDNITLDMILGDKYLVKGT